jgi:hypothetical protein
VALSIDELVDGASDGLLGHNEALPLSPLGGGDTCRLSADLPLTDEEGPASPLDGRFLGTGLVALLLPLALLASVSFSLLIMYCTRTEMGGRSLVRDRNRARNHFMWGLKSPSNRCWRIYRCEESKI